LCVRAETGSSSAPAAVAADLLEDLVPHAQGAPFYVDVPDANPGAVEMIAHLGLEPVFHTARMYRGPDAPLDVERVFGITTLELG